MASKFVVRDLELSLAQDTRVRAGVLSMDIFFYLVSQNDIISSKDITCDTH